MKCFYHIDEDGKCSAFWVNKLARHYDGYEKKFIPINYGVEFPFETIQPDEQFTHLMTLTSALMNRFIL